MSTLRPEVATTRRDPDCAMLYTRPGSVSIATQFWPCMASRTVSGAY